jgi:acyl carrier protein
MTPLEQNLIGYIRKEFLHDRPDLVLEPESSLIESGVVDSLGIFSLVAWLEEHQGVVVPATDVVFENFDSVAAIQRMVSRLPVGGT